MNVATNYQVIFSVKLALRAWWNYWRSFIYYGGRRYCPVCDRYFRKFGKVGQDARADAICLNCGAVERHRLIWLFLTRKINFITRPPKNMLHVAPELVFVKKFKKLIGEGYLSGDLSSPLAMVTMDITDIQQDDSVFDAIYCSHVLEHVLDDRKAIRELYRVLKPGGWAILLVPIDVEATFEDFSIVQPAERLNAFGDETHVRIYGLDYLQRLQDGGFKVKVVKRGDFLSEKEIVRMGITEAAGDIYFCGKGIEEFLENG